MEADLVKNVKRTSNIPTKDSDLSDQGQNSATTWANNPQIKLIWITPVQHKANADAYQATLGERMATGGGRKEVTAKLDALDVSIDDAITAVKGYLVYKFEKANAASYYPQFGIVHATTVDGSVSKKVGDKNELRKTILKTHNALINVLKANYPDTYKSVIREWGFQKEKY